MKIFISGGTGFIGRNLAEALAAKGHEVVVLTRGAGKAKPPFDNPDITVLEGNPLEEGAWMKEIDGCDCVINLCGEYLLGQKWTAPYKQLLRDSRIVPTRLIVEAIKNCSKRPKVLISGSAVGYYGNRGDEPLTEESSPGKDFPGLLCRDWEAEADRAVELGVRVINLRTGIVLGDGGALAAMLQPFKLGLGGIIGDGKQYIPWIHINDHIQMTIFALENEAINGPLNAVAPNPSTNLEFTESLGKSLHRPTVLPTPTFLLKMKYGEGARMLLDGQRVLPKAALAAGYSFIFGDLQKALDNLFS